MAPSRNSTRSSIKSEIKVKNGIITPNSSMTSGTISPKMEEVDISFSDLCEGIEGSFKSHDGLPPLFLEQDEGYHAERKVRSDAPSIRTSRQPSHLESVDLTAMEDLQAPGASLQIVGEKVNMLVDAIEKLRQLGLNELKEELPELVLVGDQSAGKSSLMGAIAEIKLPKGIGMCTRCPSNIKTSPATAWKCTVSLHQSYDFTGERQRTEHQEFPQWKEKPSGLEQIPFKTIYHNSELENVLRWAQIAQLNPTQDPKAYIPGTGAKAQRGLKPGDKNDADFSPNIVAIEISGPRLPALSFFDLPGIFQNPKSDEEEYLIQVFEDLAAKYIKHENALIICAMAMQNDPGTSKAHAIVKMLKAEKRCVSILTMPDRLQARHTDYEGLLKGETYVMGRGCFVTKQPGPDFQHRSNEDYHAQARQEEERFFDTDPRWTNEWKDFRKKCGTAIIQEYLSQEFANIIIQSMPNIDAKIKAQAQEVDIALSALPELPGHNVQHVVRAHLQEFSNGVRNLFEGGRGLLSSWSQLSIEFRDALQIMKPMFTYSDPSDFNISAFPSEPILIDDDSDNEPMLPPSGIKRSGANFATPQAKRPQTFNGSPIPLNLASSSRSGAGVQPPKHEGSSSQGSPPPFLLRRIPQGEEKTTVFDIFLGAGKNFMTIDQIRKVIRMHELPGHPDHIDDRAKEDICLRTVRPWSGPLECLAQHTFIMLQEAIIAVLDRKLGHYKQTQLYRASKQHVIEFLAQHKVEQRQRLREFYDLETYTMFTINHSAFEIYKAEELKILLEKRRERRVRCYVIKQAQMAKKLHTVESRAKAEKAVTDDQLRRDPFHNEIELAAYVRGYYKTASLRFADNLCQNIRGNIFAKVQKEILGLLEDRFQLNEGNDGEAKCRILMVENKREADERTALKEKQEKLIDARNYLVELVRKYKANDPGHMDDDMQS